MALFELSLFSTGMTIQPAGRQRRRGLAGRRRKEAARALGGAKKP